MNQCEKFVTMDVHDFDRWIHFNRDAYCVLNLNFHILFPLKYENYLENWNLQFGYILWKGKMETKCQFS